jgi:hypothetical protein
MSVTRAPCASKRGRRSSSMCASISPPRSERQGPPARATTPRATSGDPSLGAQRQGEGPGADGSGVEPCRIGEFALDAQQGDVRRGVAPGKARRTSRPARQHDFELAFLRQRLLRGKHQPRPPDEAAGEGAGALDPDHRRRRGCGEVGEGVGEDGEGGEIGHGGLLRTRRCARPRGFPTARMGGGSLSLPFTGRVSRRRRDGWGTRREGASRAG